MAKNVGISGIYMYFPKNVVVQEDLERYDKVATDKYTKGLGLQEMGFCGANEDVVSLALTALSGLLKKYDIDTETIGFLEVGTETLIDKSKSVKSELMKLFEKNKNVEGADVKHACYGGTQALFHAVDWLLANHEFDKRNAIVVMSDIAIYEKGPARPTGGAGAVALLITPDAPIVLDRGLRSFNMEATWDFYKPVRAVNTEFPIVNGTDSVNCYKRCLANCYEGYIQKFSALYPEERARELRIFDAVMLHCPYTKLLQKAIGLMAFHDYRHKQYEHRNYQLIEDSISLEPKDIERLEVEAAREFWLGKTEPNLELNRRIGNMYTPSLLAQLVHFLSHGESHNKKILLFAYGSGALSAMFSLTTNETPCPALKKMERICAETVKRLDQRTVYSSEQYTAILENREELLNCVPPYETSQLDVFPDTFVLQSIDKNFVRNYKQI